MILCVRFTQIRKPALEPITLLNQIAGVSGLFAVIHHLFGRLNTVALIVKGHFVLIDAPLRVERDVRRHLVGGTGVAAEYELVRTGGLLVPAAERIARLFGGRIGCRHRSAVDHTSHRGNCCKTAVLKVKRHRVRLLLPLGVEGKASCHRSIKVVRVCARCFRIPALERIAHSSRVLRLHHCSAYRHRCRVRHASDCNWCAVTSTRVSYSWCIVMKGHRQHPFGVEGKVLLHLRFKVICTRTVFVRIPAAEHIAVSSRSRRLIHLSAFRNSHLARHISDSKCCSTRARYYIIFIKGHSVLSRQRPRAGHPEHQHEQKGRPALAFHHSPFPDS